MWKTRNIRRRNRGKKTKKQNGGLLGFGGLTTLQVIEYAIKKETEVEVHIEKKVNLVKTVPSSTFKVQFFEDGKMKFISYPEPETGTTVDIPTDKLVRYVLKGSKLEVTMPNTNKKETIVINKDFIMNIETKMKADSKTKVEELKSVNNEAILNKQKEENEAIKIQKAKDKYVVEILDAHGDNSFKRKDWSGKMPYSKSELNDLYYCIQTYLNQPITPASVKTFIEEYKKYDVNTKRELNMEKDDAIATIQVAIDSFGVMSMMNSDKRELKEIKEKLQIPEYMEPVYSVSKDCNFLNGSRKICFFVKCIQKYIDFADNEIDLLDFDVSPSGSITAKVDAKIKVSDLIENGPTLKKNWQSVYDKNVEFKNYYFYVAYVSDTSNVDSFMGMVCYAHNSDMLKVSNIIENKEVESPHAEYKDTLNKLHDIFKRELSGDDLKKVMFIPKELDGFVNQEKYKKDESNSNEKFSVWISIKHFVQHVEPVVAIVGTPQDETSTLSPEDRASKLLESLLEKLTKLTTIPIQQGGADVNELLNQVISKYPKLAGLKTVFDNLPPVVKAKYSSQLTEVLDKVDKSNVNSDNLKEVEADVSELEGIVAPQKEPTPEETPVQNENAPVQSEETPVQSENAPSEEPNAPAEGETVQADVLSTQVEGENTPAQDENEQSITTTTETPTPTTIETPTVTTPTIPTITPETTTDMPIVITTTPTETTTETPTVATTPTVTTTTIPTTPSETTTPTLELKREDLKESPLLVQPSTGESGKYIFVPKDLVEKVVDFLINNGCEITTTQIK